MTSPRWKLPPLRAGLAAGLILCGGLAVCARALADDCPDAWITTKVTTRLLAQKGLNIFKINVDTRVCVVTLRGCVKTAAQKAEAGKIARKVKRVREVKNNLTLCESSD